MFNVIMIVVIGAMVHNLCAMEPEKQKKQKKTMHLALPDYVYNKKTSPSTSPHDSPNGSANSSPRHSPKENIRSRSNSTEVIRISPGRSKNDSRVSFPELFERQLWTAVYEDNTEKALSTLQPNLNICNKSGKSLLIVAIKNKNEEIVKSLLGHKNIDLNKADKLGNTPLHHAVLACNEAIIRLLLSDYRVNSFIKSTNGGFLPHQLTDHEFYSDKKELKEMFFARLCLDSLVTDQTFSFQDCQYDDDKIDSGVAFIKKLNSLPAYATDEFIKQMILYRVSESQKIKTNINNLRIS